jgi:transcriptional regulator with XRE-family HTH domain
MSPQQNPNRIKVVLAEKQRTSHWLAVELGKTDMTISRWCTNKAQPSVMQLVQIARLLDVDVTDLLNKTKAS